MVADVLVNKDDLIIDRGRKRVGLCEEMVFRIVFDRTDKGSLLAWRKILVVCNFLEATGNVRAISTKDVNLGRYVEY